MNKDAETDATVKPAAAAWFKRMEDGDETALANWREWRALSVRKYAEEYERLNVHFDVYTGESEVGKEWQDKALQMLETMGLVSDVDGAKLVDLEKWKLQKAVLRKKGASICATVYTSGMLTWSADGTSIYLTRDIGGAIERYEKHKFDKMIYVISSQQDLHVAQFFKILKLMDLPWADRLELVNYGLVQGMSTRKGTVVFLEQIIREAATVMHDQMRKNEAKYAQIEDPEHTSTEIGITGVKIQDMTAKRYELINIPSLIIQLNPMCQNQQLHLQLGPHALLRGRHRALSAIRTRPRRLHRAQKPVAPPAPAAPRHRHQPADRARRAADRVPARRVPGRRQGRAGHARAERRRHVRDAPQPCDRERVGGRDCEGRAGRGEGAREAVVVYLCEGCAECGDEAVEFAAAGEDVSLRDVGQHNFVLVRCR